jgi:hypothetical protein
VPKVLKFVVISAFILFAGFLTAKATSDIRWGEYYQENGIRIQVAGVPLPTTRYGYINGEEIRGQVYKYPPFSLRAITLNTLIYSTAYTILVLGYLGFVKLRKRK